MSLPRHPLQSWSPVTQNGRYGANTDPPNSRRSQQGAKTADGGANRTWSVQDVPRKHDRRTNTSGGAGTWSTNKSPDASKQNTITGERAAREDNSDQGREMKSKTSHKQPKNTETGMKAKQKHPLHQTTGAGIRTGGRMANGDWSRRALTSVPPGTEISPGAPPETIRFRVASAQHQCGSSSRISSRQADSVSARTTTVRLGDCTRLLSASRPNANLQADLRPQLQVSCSETACPLPIPRTPFIAMTPPIIQ